jgi:hypothetical protein
MPISEFLHGLRFDPETKRAMGIVRAPIDSDHLYRLIPSSRSE